MQAPQATSTQSVAYLDVHALGQREPQGLPPVPIQLDVDGPVRQALPAELLGDVVAEHGADRAVEIGHSGFNGYRHA